MTLEKSETEVYCGLGNACKQMQPFHWEEAEKFVKHTAKFIAFLTILLIFFSTNALLVGQGVKLIERFEISAEPEPLLDVWSFCVTDDELVMIPDYKAGNIKVYEKNAGILELVKIIGRKGYGNNEFVRPTVCFYNSEESKFGVMDHGLRKIFLYDRINGRLDFERVREILCKRKGTDFQLIGDRLFISGYASDPNKRNYDFYFIDLTKNENDPNQQTYLLPSYLKYGLKSNREYEIQFLDKYDIPAIGIKGWFDIHKDDAYFIWEGALKIIRINIVSGDIYPDKNGIKPPHYIKPFPTIELRDAYLKRDIDLIQNKKERMSYVENIFVNSKYVLVIYEGPVNPGAATNCWLQFYTLDLDFLKEVPIPGNPKNMMWFDKNKALLYSLSSKMRGDKQYYYVLKYEIHD